MTNKHGSFTNGSRASKSKFGNQNVALRAGKAVGATNEREINLCGNQNTAEKKTKYLVSTTKIPEIKDS